MSDAAPRWMIVPATVLVLSLGLILTSPLGVIGTDDFVSVRSDAALRSSAFRTLITSICSAGVAIFVAVPTAYRASRDRRTARWVDPVLDVVLAMPPLVIGLCLLLLFRQGVLRPVDDAVGVSLQTPAILVAQTVVAVALATRLLRDTFDHFPRDAEAVARSLGATPSVVFRHVVWPATRSNITAAGLLAWSRAFGEFGPVLLFAGVTRFETEVLSTSIHLELSQGHVGTAATIALGMMLIAVLVTVVVTRLTRSPR